MYLLYYMYDVLGTLATLMTANQMSYNAVPPRLVGLDDLLVSSRVAARTKDSAQMV